MAHEAEPDPELMPLALYRLRAGRMIWPMHRQNKTQSETRTQGISRATAKLPLAWLPFNGLPLRLGAFLLIVVGLTCMSAHAGKTLAFSRASLNEAYRQGDFEKIVISLKPILTPGNFVSRIDSIFAYRLLGVVYAADPKTREVGRHCFMKLLDLDPKANLVDLFVGEELDNLWEKTRVEHRVLQRFVRVSTRDTAWLTPEDAEALQRLFDAEEADPTMASGKEDAAVAGMGVEAKDQPLNNAHIPWQKIPFGNAPVTDTRPAVRAEFRSESRSQPFWRRPGTWIAAGMAAGVVGFTVYYTLGDENPGREKLYHVSKETASSR
jgi:hypothetical protein